MQWERTRVPITLTPTCTQPPGSRPQTLRVSTHGQRAAPFRRSLTSLHGDAVGIFYALTDRAVDRKLSFIPHINYLKAKCHKALQLLRVVAHTDWGADKSTLLKLYKSLVRSKLDYGCFIYGSARKSYLRCLDSIHHLGLRLALGALRTSPVEGLYVEANEAPLSLNGTSKHCCIIQNFNPAHPTLHSIAL